MRECWLRPNARGLWFSAILPALICVVGLLVATGWPGGGTMGVLRWIGWGLAGVGGLAVAALAYLARLPRLGYEDGHLVVYLRWLKPVTLPVELAECFFLGQARSMLTTPTRRELETTTLVIRLSESADPWHNVPVKPALGHWCDGYITIRGTWCEPLSLELVKRLNRRLADVHRQLARQEKLG